MGITALGLTAAGLGIQGALGGIGDALNYHYQKKLMARQFDYQTKLIDKQNDYNSPINSMQRLKDAGLNPYSYIQGVSAGSQPSAGSAPSVPSTQVGKSLSSLQVLSAYNSVKEQQADISLKKAQEEELRSRANLNNERATSEGIKRNLDDARILLANAQASTEEIKAMNLHLDYDIRNASKSEEILGRQSKWNTYAWNEIISRTNADWLPRQQLYEEMAYFDRHAISVLNQKEILATISSIYAQTALTYQKTETEKENTQIAHNRVRITDNEASYLSATLRDRVSYIMAHYDNEEERNRLIREECRKVAAQAGIAEKDRETYGVRFGMEVISWMLGLPQKVAGAAAGLEYLAP